MPPTCTVIRLLSFCCVLNKFSIVRFHLTPKPRAKQMALWWGQAMVIVSILALLLSPDPVCRGVPLIVGAIENDLYPYSTAAQALASPPPFREQFSLDGLTTAEEAVPLHSGENTLASQP